MSIITLIATIIGYIVLIIITIAILIFIGVYLYASYNDWKEKQSIMGGGKTK